MPKVKPALNIHETYTRMHISNPFINDGGGETVFIDQPNLIPFPNEYENAYWIKKGATIDATLQLSPDDTIEARKITIASNSLGLYSSNSVSVTSGQLIRISVWVKADAVTDIIIGFNGATQLSNNKGQLMSVGTTWSKITFEAPAEVSDSGLFVCVAGTKWSTQSQGVSALNIYEQRIIDVWGASFNIT